ncbi:cytochrome b5 [Thelephora ganbajun]|uniref:Cytochrome b5 n=1 Tax=Thelephora ganbajun TaxID=370292 RepID=A0ACB6ZNH8_THEGA|nr:cytochrome b5 [Thelephora ganbajun]
MAFSVGNPVNTALMLYIIYRVNSILFPPVKPPTAIPHDFRDGYSWMPKSHPPTMLYKAATFALLRFIALTTYTPKTLAPFNGVNGQRILLAINGVVFDVSRGRNFYGPEGMYANFAGRDASRGMAKQSFDEEMLTDIDRPLDKLQDLTPSEIENMNGWIDHFSSKYTVCGRLVNEDEV